MDENLCPKMEATLKLLGKKWVGLILFTLLTGPKKFTDIEKYIPGISARMLTERLRELDDEGVILKNVTHDKHVHISYELTQKGVELSHTFDAMNQWAQKWYQ